MRTYSFSAVVLPIFLALVSMPLDSRAFVGTRQINKAQPRSQSLHSNFLKERSHFARANHAVTLQGKKINAESGNDDNIVFQTLSTDRDRAPNQGTFFYNDEVISHLYGYMYLVGLFAAQDALFLGNFLVLSSASAWATQESILPCNPRIPAVTAAATLALTIVLRYGLGFEPPLQDLLGETYQGPTESAFLFEVAICLLNIGWGFFGTWRTKEQVNGATYGF